MGRKPKGANHVPKSTKKVCACCGENKSILREYYTCESKLYSIDNRHIICKDCMIKRYNMFLARCSGKEDIALRRTCDSFDYVYSERLVSEAKKLKEENLFVAYMKKLTPNSTYKAMNSIDSPMFGEIPVEEMNEELVITPDIKLKWGDGFELDEYKQLEYWFKEYLDEYRPKDLATKKILKDLCTTEMLRERARQNGDDKTYDMYSKLLSKIRSDANIQPSQNKDEDKDNKIFGMKMRAYETRKPVAKRLKEYLDVDGFEQYIQKHLFKPLAVALGLASNNYTMEDGDNNIQYDEKLERVLKEIENDEKGIPYKREEDSPKENEVSQCTNMTDEPF